MRLPAGLIVYTLYLLVLFEISCNTPWDDQVLVLFKLIGSHITCRRTQERWNTVHDCCASVLNCCRLYHVEFSIGFAGDLRVAHVAAIGAVDFADSLIFNNNPLHRLDGDYSRRPYEL